MCIWEEIYCHYIAMWLRVWQYDASWYRCFTRRHPGQWLVSAVWTSSLPITNLNNLRSLQTNNASEFALHRNALSSTLCFDAPTRSRTIPIRSSALNPLNFKFKCQGHLSHSVCVYVWGRPTLVLLICESQVLNMDNMWIYVLIMFAAICAVAVLYIIIKKKLRIYKLRKHLAADYVVECHEINTKNETRLLLKQMNQDYQHSYCQQHKVASYTTSL